MAAKKGQTHKVVQVLKALSKEELQEFKTYLASGLEKVRPQVRQLFTWMQKYPTKMDDQAAVQQYVKTKVEAMSEQKLNMTIRKLRSELYEALKNYLIYQQFKQDTAYQDKCLLDSLNTKRIHDVFDKEWNRIQKKQEAATLLSDTELLHQLHAQQIYVHHKTIVDNRNPETEATIGQLLQTLEDYYLLLHLKYGVSWWSKADVLNTKSRLTQYVNLPLLSPNHQSIFAEKTPLIQLYYYLYLLFTDIDSLKWYVKVTHLLEKQGVVLVNADKRHAYTCILNYCAKQVRKGKQPYIRKAFEVYQKMFAEKIVYAEDGYVHPAHFNNFIKLASRINELAQVKQFVEDTKQDIRPLHRENAYRFYCASILFAEQKYEEAEQALKQIYSGRNKNQKLIDFFYNIEGRLLRIQALYELKEEQEEALEAALVAFRRYLQDNQVVAEDRELAYVNFINVLKRLCRKYWAEQENRLHKKQRRVASKAVLLKEVEQLKPLVERQWLVEKGEEFDK